MNRIIALFGLIGAFSFGIIGQQRGPEKTQEKVATSASDPADLAKATLSAHGGEKLRGIRSLILRGSVYITA
ncbi:MAG: hypothetical protein ACREO5_14975, partial [Candidatus Binatia bacterium]